MLSDMETLANRARLVKRRLLAYDAPAVKIVITYDGHLPNEPLEPGLSIKVECGPYLAVAALEALADELDRRKATGETAFPTAGMLEA